MTETRFLRGLWNFQITVAANNFRKAQSTVLPADNHNHQPTSTQTKDGAVKRSRGDQS